ncbi:hypothetical protein [Nocardioides sp. B-3]|uniref:hypothetical protein n=1 Tax=Nocardioides sp. B-3 TaxID=2895565 RepID=UPI002152D565|nr:hypothetical protein [Nocardioides sp. B-3]UUZ57922.1 hypothetical protein LP418_16375 [Nocardioides sp. B-3]
MRTVVVAACPAALLGCSGPPEAVPEPTPEPRVVVTATASPEEPLPTSRPPRTAVVAGHTLTYPDGRTVRLPRDRGVTGIAAYGDGYLVADNRFFEGTLAMSRLDSAGRVLDTGPAPGRRSWRRTAVARVSPVAPESGETGPTLIHVGERTQELSGIFSPYLPGFDGETVTFVAHANVHGRWITADYATDLVDPPRRTGTSPRLARYHSPSGENWYGYRRRSLRLVTPDGFMEIRAGRLVRTMGGLFWEDDRHLLGTYVRDGRMAIARIDMRGRISIASPLAPQGHRRVRVPRAEVYEMTGTKLSNGSLQSIRNWGRSMSTWR